MSVNLSSYSNFPVNPTLHYCSDSTTVIILYAFIILKYGLIIPLGVLIIFLLHRRWRQQCSFRGISHSDMFTFHLIVMELTGAFGGALYLGGFSLPDMITVGSYLLSASLLGENMFHLLTCVERYLAVIHPVIYLGLKKTGGVRIRNICIGCVWLLYLGWIGLMVWYSPDVPVIPFFCFFTFSFIVVSFCSMSVVCVLIHPGPGKVGGDREHIDQSKKRAFHTVMVITGVLWLMFAGQISSVVPEALAQQSHYYGCLLFASGILFNLPSSLVLPLLFLHRAGKLKCCCANSH